MNELFRYALLIFLIVNTPASYAYLYTTESATGIYEGKSSDGSTLKIEVSEAEQSNSRTPMLKMEFIGYEVLLGFDANKKRFRGFVPVYYCDDPGCFQLEALDVEISEGPSSKKPILSIELHGYQFGEGSDDPSEGVVTITAMLSKKR